MSTTPTEGSAPSARRTIATYSEYQDAERAVDWLSDQGFAVERVTIVGTGLRYVEQVAGRVTTGRAALTTAGQGAAIGLLFGLLFTLFFDLSTGDFFGVLLYGLVAGAIWGAIFGAIFHSAQRGRRDFASTTQTRADRYEVQVDESVADEAKRLLDRMTARTA
jgi:Heat induced stress protein YflT domain